MSSLSELAAFCSPWSRLSCWHSRNLIYQAACEKNLKRGVKYLLRFSDRELLQDSKGIFHNPMTFEVVEPPAEKPARIWKSKTCLSRNYGGNIQRQFHIRQYLHDRVYPGSGFFGFFRGSPFVNNEAIWKNRGYVVNGMIMDESGFTGLNEKLKWPITANDLLLDDDITDYLLEFDLEAKVSEFDAICPIDGPIQTIPAAFFYNLPSGALPDDILPDSIYRLCPYCLMTLASKTIVMR